MPATVTLGFKKSWRKMFGKGTRRNSRYRVWCKNQAHRLARRTGNYDYQLTEREL